MAAAFFDQCLQDRLQLARYRRKSTNRFAVIQAVVERLESEAMERLDVDANADERLDKAESKIRFHHLRQAMGTSGSWLGEKAAPRLTSDSTLRAHVERSTLSVPLRDTRTFLEKQSHELMQHLDDSRRELKFIFEDVTSANRILANPKGDFENALRKLWINAEHQIGAMFKGIDGRLLSMAKATQPIAKKVCRAISSQTLSDDCGCEASKTVRTQQQSMSELGSTIARMKQTNAQLDRDLKAAQESVAAAVDSLASIQRCGYKALSAFHKHRFRWCSTVPDTTRGVETVDYSPSGVLCIVEAAKTHRDTLERFQKWVLSDDQGGACFTKVTPSTARAPSKEVENPFQENPTARMDDWAARQSELWTRRRASLVTAPVNVRLDAGTDAFTPRVPVSSSSSFRRRHSAAY